MKASRLESKASPWGTRALVAIAVLLLVVDALLSWLSMARNPANAADSLGYWSQQSARFLGAAVATAVFVGVAIAGARAAGGARTLASKAKVACWTLVGLLVLNCSTISRYAPAQSTEDRDAAASARNGDPPGIP